jgi:hypothetical protein
VTKNERVAQLVEVLTGGPLRRGPIMKALGIASESLFTRIVEEGIRRKVVAPWVDRTWALVNDQRMPQPGRPEGIVIPPVSTKTSWWADHAAPEARAGFVDAARARNAAQVGSPEWMSRQRPRIANMGKGTDRPFVNDHRPKEKEKET